MKKADTQLSIGLPVSRKVYKVRGVGSSLLSLRLEPYAYLARSVAQVFYLSRKVTNLVASPSALVARVLVHRASA